MGTSLLKFAALLGFLCSTIPPAYCAGAVGSGVAAPGSVGQIGATPSPGLGGLPGSGIGNNGLMQPGLANRGLANQNLTAQGAGISGTTNGLSASEQSLLMNFGSPTTPSGAGVSTTQQMQANAQSNAEAGLRSGMGQSPTPSVASTGLTGATGGNPAPVNLGASLATTTSTVPAAPVISPPVVNNAGSLAETAQPGTLR